MAQRQIIFGPSSIYDPTFWAFKVIESDVLGH